MAFWLSPNRQPDLAWKFLTTRGNQVDRMVARLLAITLLLVLIHRFSRVGGRPGDGQSAVTAPAVRGCSSMDQGLWMHPC